MKNLIVFAAALWCAQAAFSQTSVNGKRIQVGDWDGGVAPSTRLATGNGAPAQANCNSAAAITSSTNASPIVVTKASHGLVNGQVVTVYGHAIDTAANGTWMVGGATTNTFTLCGYWDGTTCQNPSSGNGVGAATGFFSTQVGRIYFRNDAAAGQNLYYCTDATGSPVWTQVSVMAASGSSHAAGLAPDPGATAGTTHFLREDATWNVPAYPVTSVFTQTGAVGNLSGDVVTSGSSVTAIAANAVTSAKMAAVNTRRVCMLGATNAPAVLADTDLGSLGANPCYVPYAGTVVEVMVKGDAGTPQIIVGRDHAGTIANLTSSALATAASGARACSNTGGTTGLDGATTCTNTLQSTSLSAGDWIVQVSGTAGGTAKQMAVAVVWTVN